MAPRRMRESVNEAVDYVVELRKFRERYPWVLITSPKQNGTLCWEASWHDPEAEDDDSSPLHGLKHSDLRTVLGNLRKQFGEA